MYFPCKLHFFEFHPTSVVFSVVAKSQTVSSDWILDQDLSFLGFKNRSRNSQIVQGSHFLCPPSALKNISSQNIYAEG